MTEARRSHPAVRTRRTRVLESLLTTSPTSLGSRGPVVTVQPPSTEPDPTGPRRPPQTLWLCEHLDHLTEHLGELVTPAADFAKIRRRPWWR